MKPGLNWRVKAGETRVNDGSKVLGSPEPRPTVPKAPEPRPRRPPPSAFRPSAVILLPYLEPNNPTPQDTQLYPKPCASEAGVSVLWGYEYHWSPHEREGGGGAGEWVGDVVGVGRKHTLAPANSFTFRAMLRPNREALRLACSVVAAIAALHVGWILVLLRRDAAEPNFAALRTEDQLQLLSREIVLMHHKRLPELNNTLSRLGGLADADRLRITLIQSLDASEASAADATAALLRSISIRFPWLRIDHKPIVRALEAEGGGDGTYSVDAKQYGTKRNSFRNLLAGLDAVFASHPELRSAIVLEDDVLLANDAIDFFDMAASLLDERSSVAAAADSPVTARPVLATSFCFMRDNHEDYRWWRHLWARGIAGGATRYRVGPLRAVTVRRRDQNAPSHRSLRRACSHAAP
jgi:hypothetical protein